MTNKGAWLWIGLLLSPSVAHAGAWTLEQGRSQVIVTGNANTADHGFDGTKLVPIPRYNKDELQALIEYGVTDRLTAIVIPGLQHVDIAAPFDGRRTGLNYAEFGGRYQLLKGDSWVLSGQVTERVPGTSDVHNPAAIGYTDAESDVRALLGYSFKLGAMPAFIDVQLAQRFRAGAPPNELRADATFGLRIARQWLLLAQSFNVLSEGTGNFPFRSYEYYKLQLSVAYELTSSLALQLGGFTTYTGRNALQENALIFGVWYRF